MTTTDYTPTAQEIRLARIEDGLGNIAARSVGRDAR